MHDNAIQGQDSFVNDDPCTPGRKTETCNTYNNGHIAVSGGMKD